MDNQPPWILAHQRGCSLEEFKETLTPEQRTELVGFLRACSRWADIKSLMNDPVYGEDATAQYNHQQECVAYEAQRQQQIAAMPEVFQRITLAFRKIWWIADVHYPYTSKHVPNSNMCFTGDGMGLAYFNVQSENDITLVKCDDEDFVAVLGAAGIVVGTNVDAGRLLKAVENYVVLVNGKFERFTGQRAIGYLNPD